MITRLIPCFKSVTLKLIRMHKAAGGHNQKYSDLAESLTAESFVFVR